MPVPPNTVEQLASLDRKAPRESTRQWLHALLGVPAFGLAAGLLPWYLAALGICAGLIVHNVGWLDYWTRSLVRRGERVWRDGPSCYAYGLLLPVCVLSPFPAACGWVALAWGDALSNLVGRKIPIISLRERRSLGGLLGMMLGTGLGIWGLGIFAGVPLPGPGPILLVCTVGGIIELLADPWDDNLVIPAGVAMAFVGVGLVFPLAG